MRNRFICRKKSALIILLIIISALAIRLYNLNKYDLWFDEIISNLFSHQSLERDAAVSGRSIPSLMFEKCHDDPHSSFYYLLIYSCSFFLKGWWSLRVLSVIFSTLSLLVFYKLARLIYDRSTGIFALLLMAMSPFQVWYAQEMRAYAISGFFALLATLFFVKLLVKEKNSYWVYFFISGIFALLTNYYSVLLLIIALIFLLFKRNFQYSRKACLSIAILLVFFVSLLGPILHRFYMVKNFSWLLPPALRNLSLSFAVFGLGYSAHYFQLIIGLYILAALFIYGIYKSFKDKNKYTVFLLSSFLLPIIVIFIISKITVPLYIDRQFIVITPFYYLLIAKGITGIKNIKIKLSTCIVLAALMISLLVNYYNGFMLRGKNGGDFYTGVHERKQYRLLFAYLYDNLAEKDIVAATDIQSYLLTLQVMRARFKYSCSHWLLFYPERLDRVAKSSFYDLRKIPQDKIKGSPDTLHGFYYCFYYPVITEDPVMNKTIKRIWLVTSFWDRDGLHPVSNDHKRMRARLLSAYNREEVKEKDGIILERFVRR